MQAELEKMEVGYTYLFRVVMVEYKGNGETFLMLNYSNGRSIILLY